MLAYIGAGFLLLGVFFIMIGTHYGLVLGLGIFIILMGLISSILAATGKKDEQEAVSV